MFTRRSLLKLAGLSPLAKVVGIQVAHAEDREFKHALTLFDDIKYPAGFQAFRLCESGGAEGRPGAVWGGRLVRQPEPLYLQGRSGGCCHQ